MEFTDNAELDRQGRYTPPSQVTGRKELFLNALGYKGSGEANKFGKVLNFVPGLNLARNMVAGGISQGTDTNAVIKGQRDEAFANTMAGVNLGLQGAKFASGLGTFGATAGLASNAAAGGAGAILNDIQQNADTSAVQDDLKKELEQIDTKQITDPDYTNYVGMPGPGNNETGLGSALTGGQKMMNVANKVNNFTSKLPAVGGVSEALSQSILTGAALNKAGTDELNKVKRNQVYNSTFNYL